MKLVEIKELYLAGVSGNKIAEMAGAHPQTIYTRLRAMGIPIGKVGQRPGFYVVYDKHGNVITTGSSKECAAFMGVTPESFRCAVNRDKKGKVRKWYAVRVIDGSDKEAAQQ